MTTKFLFKACILLLATSLLWSCSDDDNKEPDPTPEPVLEYGWSKTMAGNDPKERLWPDFSENYWEYTLDVTEHANVGLRFKGQFPNKDTRFFNLTFYNDETTKRIASIEDFDIEANKDSKNPFETENVVGNNYFEINVIPTKTAETVKKDLKNVIVFDKDDKTVKRLSMLLRVYYNSVDHGTDFGGVALPEIVFFDIETGKEVGKAVRAESKYYEQAENILGKLPIVPDVPMLMFTLAPDIIYSNGPTGYVTGVNRLKVGEKSAVVFRFLPPQQPTSVATNRTADVRYWSVCVGDMKDTYTKTTLPDHAITLKDGYANFIMIEKSVAERAEIIAKAKEMDINVMEWDTHTDGEPFMIFHRQMHINKDFKYSVQKIKPYPGLDENGRPIITGLPTAENLASVVLGEHGPSGKKISVDKFLAKDFTYSMMR